MEGRVAALFDGQVDVAGIAAVGYEVLNEIPWKQIARLVQWATYLEGLGWPARTTVALGLFVAFCVCERTRRTWGLRAFEYWNVCCEYLAHLFFLVLVGPAYVLICLNFKLMGANRFRDGRRLLAVTFLLICFPTLVSYFGEREPRRSWLGQWF